MGVIVGSGWINVQNKTSQHDRRSYQCRRRDHASVRPAILYDAANSVYVLVWVQRVTETDQ